MKTPTEMHKEILDAVDYAQAQVLQGEVALHLSNVKEVFGDDIPSMVECSTVTEAIAKLAVEHPDRCDVKKLIRGLVAMHLAHIHTDKENDANLKEAIKMGVEASKSMLNEEEGK